MVQPNDILPFFLKLFQTVVNNYDRNKDGRLDYDEFLSYMSDREKKWRIHFMALDKNKCGKWNGGVVQSSVRKKAGRLISGPNPGTRAFQYHRRHSEHAFVFVFAQ